MRITDRDRALLEDIGLHQVMSRNQILHLGYFGSIQRTNARLLTLVRAGLVRRVNLGSVAESSQSVYTVSKAAGPWIESRIAKLVDSRSARPKHLEHSLHIIDVRLNLARLGMTKWLPEVQIRHQYSLSSNATRTEEFRPDGLAIFGSEFLFLEVDLGNVSLPRFKEKFDSFEKYVRLGVFTQTYNLPSFSVLVVTTGGIRANGIRSKVPKGSWIDFKVCTFKQLSAAKSVQEVTQA